MNEAPEKYCPLIKGSSRLSVDDARQGGFAKRPYLKDELFQAVYRVFNQKSKGYKRGVECIDGFHRLRKFRIPRSP